jgi:plastocyanin
MKRLLVVGCVVALAATEAFAGGVSGRVSFVTKRGQNPIVNETLVWLEPAAGTRAAKRAPSSTFTMTTRGKTLLPHVLAIPAGSTVTFPNEDPISHNLFSLSSASSFDLGLYRAGAGKSHTFPTPGAVNVYCNVHPSMSSVIHVMSTPFYGFADGAGNFSLADVAPGKYEIVAWNEQGGVAHGGTLDVPPAGLVNIILTIDSRNFRVAGHTNKEGKPYEAPRSKEY